MTAMLALSLLLALVSAVALNWAFYRQQGQVCASARLSPLRPVRALRLLFGNRRWLAGFAVGILGWVFYVAALRFGPLSLVQATSAGGIGVLALLVWRIGGVGLSRREWTGVAGAVGGLAALGLSMVPADGAHHLADHASWTAIAIWLLASALLAGLAAGPGRRLTAPGAGFALGAGLLYAAGDVATKGAVLGGWWLLFVPAVLAAHGLAFVLLQLAFQRGKVLATAGVATLVTNAAPIAAGMAVFHDPLPSGIRGVLRLFAFATVLAGAVLLTRSSRPERTMTRSSRRAAALIFLAIAIVFVGAANADANTRHTFDRLERHTVDIGRSVDGRPIVAIETGDLDSANTALVVGCIHRNECAGVAVADDLALRPPPAELNLWIIPDLNPEGSREETRGNARGVDLNRNFPWHWRHLYGIFDSGPHALSEPESRAAFRLILGVRPRIAVWFHQHLNVVDESGGKLALERRFAAAAGMRLVRLAREPGSAVGWENHSIPTGTAFVVELQSGAISSSAAARLTSAVLMDSRAAGRGGVG